MPIFFIFFSSSLVAFANNDELKPINKTEKILKMFIKSERKPKKKSKKNVFLSFLKIILLTSSNIKFA